MVIRIFPKLTRTEGKDALVQVFYTEVRLKTAIR